MVTEQSLYAGVAGTRYEVAAGQSERDTWHLACVSTSKQALGFQNPFYLKKAQRLELKLYDGNVIKNTSAIVISDSEETLILAEESRSKMILKQQDLMMLEKKVYTTPVDYAALNQLSQDFETRFVPQTELSAE
ncbi:hypothetical protein Tco_1193635 [Tanacetum coccineum]